MKLREWCKQATMPVYPPMMQAQYLRITPRVFAIVLLEIGLAFWKHNWLLVGLACLVVVLWGVFLPIVLPIQQKRWQSRQPQSRRRPGDSGNGDASAGVPRFPLPPSRMSGAARSFPKQKPPTITS